MTPVASCGQVAPAVLHALPQRWPRHPEQASRHVSVMRTPGRDVSYCHMPNEWAQQDRGSLCPWQEACAHMTESTTHESGIHEA